MLLEFAQVTIFFSGSSLVTKAVLHQLAVCSNRKIFTKGETILPYGGLRTTNTTLTLVFYVELLDSWPGGVLPNILGGGVPHGSQNPDPISDQNI